MSQGATPWVAALIAGAVGGLVGGAVVRLAPGADPLPAAPEVAPAEPPTEEPLAAEVGEAPEELEVEQPTPPPVAPAAAPEPLDPTPLEEAPPYALGVALPEDAAEFVRKEVQAAEAGELDSMLRVADWVADGTTLPGSAAEANRWYRLARGRCSADPTHASARRVLRAHARFLTEVEPAGWANPQAAVALLERSVAVNPRVADLRLDLAGHLELGLGAPADPARARQFVEQVAQQLLDRGEQGFDASRAFATLARYLQRGVGGPADLRAAALWARRAVEGKADYLVGEDDLLPALELYRELPEVPGGVTWLARYTEKHGAAAFFLGRCYEEGRHVPADRARALEHYRQALTLEHAHAAEALARLEGLEAGD
ncbi:MAG: hypothetical protein R3F62_14945 [Planctomycetota bacterium]